MSFVPDRNFNSSIRENGCNLVYREVDRVKSTQKRKNGCQGKINGSRLSLLWAKKKKWVPEKNKWESTLFTVGQKEKMGAREK